MNGSISLKTTPILPTYLAENDIKNPKCIFAVTPFTMLDFPNNTACIIWFAGCNMRCPYCHNPQIVRSKGRGEVKDIWEFLIKRRKCLDGVVLSGGEATSYPYLIPFIESLRDIGYLIKLDTNGSRPKVIQELMDKNLLDYVAIDYKSPSYKFKTVTGIKNFNDFDKTMDILCSQNKMKFEIRTTIHTKLLNENDINWIIDDLDERGYNGTYYLQNYIADNDIPTLGNLPPQNYIIKESDIIKAKNFQIEFRNF